MSIRIGIYDFFAYLIPGVFYLMVAAFGLKVFGILNIDQAQLFDISLFGFVVLLAAGFLVGMLFDPIAFKWFLLFRLGNSITRKEAFAFFKERYPWLEINFSYEDWAFILQAIKIQVPDVTADIEQHNAVHILLRNISLGLFLTALIFLFVFIFVFTHIGNLAVAASAAAFSYLAIKRSAQRRWWFYMGIYETFAANLLLQQKKLDNIVDLKQVQAKVGAKSEETVEG